MELKSHFKIILYFFKSNHFLWSFIDFKVISIKMNEKQTNETYLGFDLSTQQVFDLFYLF